MVRKVVGGYWNVVDFLGFINIKSIYSTMYGLVIIKIGKNVSVGFLFSKYISNFFVVLFLLGSLNLRYVCCLGFYLMHLRVGFDHVKISI